MLISHNIIYYSNTILYQKRVHGGANENKRRIDTNIIIINLVSAVEFVFFLLALYT